MTAAVTPPLRILRDADSALALLDPDRRRLAEALAEGPDSAAGLARRLGEKRQRLNYHLRVLEEAGLVELVEERRRGNRTERVLRLVAQRFVVDPGAVGDVAIRDPEEVGDRFSAAYLVALAARAIRELAALMDRAKAKRSRLASASVNASVRIASPEGLDAFVGDLTRAVADVVARYHEEDGDGRWFRVIAGAYPGPSPRAEEDRS
ncbi:MAG TPA: helix-turn-helix domain-containing protein [Longimicrobiales bacterium]